MYSIMLVKSGIGIDATYNYLSTVEAETGSKVKKEFATLAEAEAYVQSMVSGGAYSLNSFIVVKNIRVTAGITLAEETA